MHLADNVDPPLSIAWGIIVGLLASCIQSLGLTIQRKNHVLNQQLPLHLQRPDYRRPLWLLGFLIFISSNILGSLFQIASLPVVILAPLGAVSLLWNAFFARFLLGDVFSLWMLLGTILIAGGAVLIAIFGIVPEPTHSLEELLQLLNRPTFIAYFSLLGAAVLACLIITHIAEFSLKRHVLLPSPELTPPVTPGPLEAAIPPSFEHPTPRISFVSENTPLLDRKNVASRPESFMPFYDGRTKRARLLIAISYASTSGILSGMCLLFAKSGVELLILTIEGKNQFWRWEAWVLLLGLGIFALLQLWYLQRSLAYADPTIICPLAFCFYNVSSIVNGLVYFDQFSLLSPLQLSLVSLGIVILLGGVWLVSFHAGSGRVDVGTWQEGDDDLEEEEEADEAIYEHETYRYTDFAPPAFASAPSDSETHAASPYSITFPMSPDVEQHRERLDSRIIPLSPPVSPTISRIRMTQPRRLHRFSILQPSESTIPGGGISIGLSPASPGFTIVPKGRIGRKLRRAVQRATMRRTVSEGDADDARNATTSIQAVSSESGAPRLDEGSRNDGPGQRMRALARWKWLRSVFTDRDS